MVPNVRLLIRFCYYTNQSVVHILLRNLESGKGGLYKTAIIANNEIRIGTLFKRNRFFCSLEIDS